MYKIISRFVSNNFGGKVKYQPFFELLHRFTLMCMHYGKGSNVSTSGEMNVINFISKKLQSKNVILFDVGANIGNYSKILLSEFSSIQQLYCFEPSTSTFEQLKINLNNKPITVLVNKGLGEIKEKLTLYSATKNSEIASIFPQKELLEKYGVMKEETIEIISLDEFCTEEKIAHIDFLKLDVEGYEISVLKGAKNMISSKAISYIQFEFGITNINSKTYFKDIWDILFEHYKIFRVVKDGLYEMKRYSYTYEIFQTTNFLAVLK
ncbi:MAG: FkbM family methyltransferase [Chitinophagaceae bacterium]|nr:FkbM family methyltransferase [Chitinophagaceae bacterium]MCW5904893.1 FkbM family methyltransferase [Chitinophagaceae bacterium]